MKKIISTLLALVIVTSFCLSVSSTGAADHTDHTAEKEIIFGEECPFNEDERQIIIERLTDGDNGISTQGFSFLCLFGHDYKVGVVTTITHCVNSTQPRCLEEVFEIGECTRCGKTYQEVIRYSYIVCCP